ncbi:DUF6804 family protein [Pedobacter rhodius]|uniref:Uncharacterized protein n=1 Tax=Pedobacter rhodius TaxID=3004098 RepID=A0ABT4L1A7_9SPHI|nr:DUF6804 family protein [Pedobacter sp. SJ11]MCZ4224962.1 hypothetical protein [Pedobacter sp. SJ11]
MKSLFIFCSAFCFIAVFNLPTTYYSFLRIIISTGAILGIYSFLKYKNYYWMIVFTIILLFFNPLFPIYLHRKSVWIPMDIVVGLLFLLLAFLKIKKEIKKDMATTSAIPKTYTRDRIISTKTKN